MACGLSSARFLRHCCDVRMVNEVRCAMPGEAEAGSALKEPPREIPQRDQPPQLKVAQVTVPRNHSVTCDLRRLRSNLPRNRLPCDAPRVLRVLRRCLPAEDSVEFVRGRSHPHFGHRSNASKTCTLDSCHENLGRACQARPHFFNHTEIHKPHVSPDRHHCHSIPLHPAIGIVRRQSLGVGRPKRVVPAIRGTAGVWDQQFVLLLLG